MYHSYSPTDLSTGQLHGTLLTGIAPRPIAFVSTIDAQGRVNLSPFSFFNIFGSNPPLLIFSPARRVRDNTTKHTLDNLHEVGECTVNIVDYAMVEQMSLASTEYDRGVNEFIKSGLTEVKSELVAAPRVGESPLSMECKIQQIIATGDQGGAGNLVIAEVIKVHLRADACGDNQLLDADKLDLVGRMGGSYYVRATGDALFEIPKPLRTKGIGVDQLPDHVRGSEILSGNDLGRLGNLAQAPTADQILAEQECLGLSPDDQPTELIDFLAEDNGLSLTQKLHQYAKELIAKGEAERALAVLFAV
ncbi:MAG: flavin reductase family protein [Bacteroidota bacterium]